MTTDETRYRIDYTHKQRLTHLYRKPANSSSPKDPFLDPMATVRTCFLVRRIPVFYVADDAHTALH